MISWMLDLLICGFLNADGLLHWRFDTNRPWLLTSTEPGELQPVSLFTTLLRVVANAFEA